MSYLRRGGQVKLTLRFGDCSSLRGDFSLVLYDYSFFKKELKFRWENLGYQKCHGFWLYGWIKNLWWFMGKIS